MFTLIELPYKSLAPVISDETLAFYSQQVRKRAFRSPQQDSGRHAGHLLA